MHPAKESVTRSFSSVHPSTHLDVAEVLDQVLPHGGVASRAGLGVGQDGVEVAARLVEGTQPLNEPEKRDKHGGSRD